MSVSFSCTFLAVSKSQINKRLAALRAEGQGIPVLIGDQDSLDALLEAHALSDQRVDEIVAAADGIDAETFLAAREDAWRHSHQKEVEAILRQAETNPGSFKDEDGQQIIADYRQMVDAGDFRVRERDEILGTWPARPRPTPDRMKTGAGPLGSLLPTGEKQHIALVPVSGDHLVFAFLKFGGWNHCPLPAEHVAVFRHWAQTYDCRFYQLTDNTLHCTVGNPPDTKEAALDLAWQHFFYCPDLLNEDYASISELASRLKDGRSWSFRWE
jgi:hypothetical protein